MNTNNLDESKREKERRVIDKSGHQKINAIVSMMSPGMNANDDKREINGISNEFNVVREAFFFVNHKSNPQNWV